MHGAGLDASVLQQITDDISTLKKHGGRPSAGIKGSMADAKRCQQMGKLGEPSVEFEHFTDSVEALVSEKYQGGCEALKWARGRGTNPIDNEALEEFALHNDVEEEVLADAGPGLVGFIATANQTGGLQAHQGG